MAIGWLVSRCLTRRVPREIDDVETTIRAIFSPYHLKKDRLTPRAFTSPPDVDQVSVSRRQYVDVWLAKAYAKRWAQELTATPPKTYRGFAILEVATLRKTEADVVDSREEYLGHADIVHGIVQQRGVALSPDVRKRLDDRLKHLAETARYVEDKAAGSWRPPLNC